MSTRIDASLLARVDWNITKGLMGSSLEVNYLLPQNRDKQCLVPDDLKNATVQNLGWQHWGPLEASEPREWAGVLSYGATEKPIHRLLRLRLAHEHTTIGNRSFSKKAYVTTGDPASWLIDSEGRLVPEVCWNKGPACSIRVLFFEPRSMVNYGWFNQQPQIGLQFLSGFCSLSQHEIGNWLITKAVGTH
jgi:hypothetical protein